MRSWRRAHGRTPVAERTLIPKTCAHCDSPFTTTTIAKRYCSHVCNVKAYDHRAKGELYRKRIARLREERKRVPEKWREIDRLRRYGMPLGTHAAMLAAQHGQCAICGELPERALQVDHDHATGRYRELLCEKCNRMLGFARDNAAILRAAIVYLGKHSRIARIA